MKGLMSQSVEENQNHTDKKIGELLQSIQKTFETELGKKLKENKVTQDEICPHYYLLFGALIVMSAIQLAFSLANFILGVRLSLKSKKRPARKDSTNTICSRLEVAEPNVPSSSIDRRSQRVHNRDSRRLSSRIMRRFDPIRNNSTLIAFLSTPPSYRAPAPPPPPETNFGAGGYQNVRYYHKKSHN